VARRTRPAPPARGTPGPAHPLLQLERAGSADDRVLHAPGAAPVRRGELLRRARGIASGLIRMGVSPGDEVLLVFTPGIAAVEAALGALAAGAVIRLVDPFEPADLADGLRFHDGDLALTVAAAPGPTGIARVLPGLVAAEARVGRELPRVVVRGVRGVTAPLVAPRQLDWSRALAAGPPGAPQAPLRAAPGGPEGLICWDPVVPGVRRLADAQILEEQVDWLRELVPVRADRLWISPGFGAPVGVSGGLLAPLLAGHGLVLDPAPRFDAGRAWALLARERVDVVITTSVGVRALRRSRPGRRPPALPALRQIVCLAGRPDPAHLRWLMRTFPGVELTLA
jgi:acyl-coenzyme A synthetase/AMP-(fatty) acid ligase